MSFSHNNQFLPLGKARMGYPSGEARWGLMSFSHSNQFLPLGKARMGYPSGEARWGLKSIGGVIIKNFMRSRFILVYRLYAFARW